MVEGVLVSFPLQNTEASSVKVRETESPGRPWGSCSVAGTITICLYERQRGKAAMHFVLVFKIDHFVTWNDNVSFVSIHFAFIFIKIQNKCEDVNRLILSERTMSQCWCLNNDHNLSRRWGEKSFTPEWLQIQGVNFLFHAQSRVKLSFQHRKSFFFIWQNSHQRWSSSTRGATPLIDVGFLPANYESMQPL